ncbi:MAG: RteC domain-containing protein [Rikenellaceae bacterium]
MNFKHLVDTQLLQSSSRSNCAQKSGMYDDFAFKVLRLYSEATDHREFVAQLIYVEIELLEALHHQPDNRYLVKASRLVQKILGNIEFELKHQTLTIKDRQKKDRDISTTYKWTADDVHFVELVYGLIESKSIENETGKIKINEFAEHLGAFLGLELRDSHDSYSSIKKRKKDNRAYFFNELAYALNKKMNHEDDLPPPSRPVEESRTLFDDM